MLSARVPRSTAANIWPKMPPPTASAVVRVLEVGSRRSHLPSSSRSTRVSITSASRSWALFPAVRISTIPSRVTRILVEVADEEVGGGANAVTPSRLVGERKLKPVEEIFADIQVNPTEAILEVDEMAVKGGVIEISALEHHRERDLAVAALQAKVEEASENPWRSSTALCGSSPFWIARSGRRHRG
jgi:hypothetical protein